MKKTALFLLLPLALFGQTADYPVPETDVPAEVAAALRERVSEFFSYHIGTLNRRGIDLVADDTKDYYYASSKTIYISAKILELYFSKDLQKALVRTETSQNMQVQQFSTVVTTPVSLMWKIENGKWVWYLDSQLLGMIATPMGASLPPPEKGKVAAVALTNPDGTLNIPKDFADPERVAAQAQAILGQAGLDSDRVAFTSGVAGQADVKFHNGFSGSVSLALYEKPSIPGLTVTLSKSELGPREDAVVRFVYAPEGLTPENLLRTYTLRLNLTPFNQEFPIKLTLSPQR